MTYYHRTYRQLHQSSDLVHFTIQVQETDLDIGVRKESFQHWLPEKTRQAVIACRSPLEEYIKQDPFFARTLHPYQPPAWAPPIAHRMATAATKAGVGPMAAVAGTIAWQIGLFLGKYSRDLIVENGGDIFIRTRRTRRIAVFAGNSPLSNRIALEVKPQDGPLGICTSSGSVGHSLSFGSADAVVVISPDPPLADAVATATGNLVKSAQDLEKALDFALSIPGITGALIILGHQLAVKGLVRLCPLPT
ncbi:MAG: UPF0280 family protein [Bacillota bacterium]|uniref:UPF0280 family protein n=1 Tax=Desulfurispora thermophila TaxID=265470 RepID=UPI0003753E20|nr:UPF0280 family protein [Desulfurispora thermophila]